MACASHSIVGQNKAWTDQLGRSFESKNLVIVSTALGSTAASAKFKSEAKGLEDLANECSFVPKGTHIEDEVTQKSYDQFIVFSKIVIEEKFCETGKRLLQLAEIEQMANLGYTEQILKNQLQSEKPVVQPPVSSKLPKLTSATKVPPMSPRQKIERLLSSDEASVIHDDGDFFMTRQQIAFLKQAILLSAKGLYPKNLVLSDKMTSVLSQKILATRNYEAQNTALSSSSVTWSFAKERINQNLKASEDEEKERVSFDLKIHRKDRRPAQKKTVLTNSGEE